jgi:hypothetical protein
VTIDRHGADYLPRLYGPARYTVLDDAKKLPLKVADIYRTADGLIPCRHQAPDRQHRRQQIRKPGLDPPVVGCFPD